MGPHMQKYDENYVVNNSAGLCVDLIDVAPVVLFERAIGDNRQRIALGKMLEAAYYGVFAKHR